MISKFNLLEKSFYSSYDDALNELESMMIEMLKNNNNLIEFESGITCNAPNYDDEWDEPFMLVKKVILEQLNDGESILLTDIDGDYSLEIRDIPIETLFAIVRKMFEEIN